MNARNTLLILSVALLFTISCRRDNVTDETLLPLDRIDLLVAGYTPGPVVNDTMQPGLDIYISMMGLDPAMRDSAMSALHDGPVNRGFGEDIVTRFGDDAVIPGFTDKVAERLAKVTGTRPIGRVYGVATPYMQSVVVADDTVVLVGLNHYLGFGYPGYGSMPAYLRRCKEPARMFPDIVEAVIRVTHPYEPVEGTLLEKMLYEGAVAKAVMYVTGLNEAETLGLSPEQYEICLDQEGYTWAAMAGEGKLYSTSSAEIARTLNPGVDRMIDGVAVPWQQGRLVGLHIVDGLMNSGQHPTISGMFDPDYYGRPQQRLVEARYNPVKLN